MIWLPATHAAPLGCDCTGSARARRRSLWRRRPRRALCTASLSRRPGARTCVLRPRAPAAAPRRAPRTPTPPSPCPTRTLQPCAVAALPIASVEAAEGTVDGPLALPLPYQSCFAVPPSDCRLAARCAERALPPIQSVATEARHGRTAGCRSLIRPEQSQYPPPRAPPGAPKQGCAAAGRYGPSPSSVCA